MHIPANYQETLAQQVRWAARNIAYNLDFLPADKLDWKPAPDASSAIEIVNHLLGAMQHVQGVLDSGEWNGQNNSEFSPSISLEDAKARLMQTADEFAATLEGILPERMERMVEMPFGTMSLAQIMRFQPIDIVYHHGQISYIQQLLGDTETHVDIASWS